MNNTIIIVFLVVILFFASTIYFDNKELRKSLVNLATEQLEVLKQQNATMQLQYEICLKQAETIQDVAVNLEDKINSQEKLINWLEKDFMSWKVPFKEYFSKTQEEWEAKQK